MHPISLTSLIAAQRAQELRAAADRARLADQAVAGRRHRRWRRPRLPRLVGRRAARSASELG